MMMMMIERGPERSGKKLRPIHSRVASFQSKLSVVVAYFAFYLDVCGSNEV